MHLGHVDSGLRKRHAVGLECEREVGDGGWAEQALQSGEGEGQIGPARADDAERALLVAREAPAHQLEQRIEGDHFLCRCDLRRKPSKPVLPAFGLRKCHQQKRFVVFVEAGPYVALHVGKPGRHLGEAV